MFSDGSIAMQEVDIFFRESTVVQQSDELFKWESCLHIWLHKNLISHVESTHHLKQGNLEREIEGSYHSNGTIGETVGCSELT